MKGILDFLIDGGPLYFYETDFKNAPNLWWEVSVLQALQGRDLSTARAFWGKLQELSPTAYLDNFIFLGDVCIFDLALKRLVFKESKTPLQEAVTAGGVDERILAFLLRSKAGVRKEELYKFIYSEDLTSKDDLNKLKNAVTRIRKKTGVEIISRKGCYVVIEAVKKAS